MVYSSRHNIIFLFLCVILTFFYDILNSFCRTDLKFCSCSDDTTVKVWDFARCQEERSLSGNVIKSFDFHLKIINGFISTFFNVKIIYLYFYLWREKRVNTSLCSLIKISDKTVRVACSVSSVVSSFLMSLVVFVPPPVFQGLCSGYFMYGLIFIFCFL